ncbi:MAG: glycoside hydrolase family 3 C-terminal domain-containing protein, partial [Clostridia bacterium]|nr:glycoside hydrolase family 3 C-terminal domain-containing protein [Clostridia bacterium]
VICLEADSAELNTALNKYYQMKKAADRGDLSEEEIERAIAEYRAVSPELIDAAADKVIDFAFKTEQMKRRFSAQENPRADITALRAARESVVLLKNEKNLLPLSRKKSACIIGDIVMGNGEENFAAEFSKFLGKEGYNIIGTQRGYDLSKERSEQLLEAAVNFAYHADTAIVFLGLGKARERNIESTARFSLPANQVALLDELEKAKCKVVAVVAGDYSTDIVLEEKADAILFAPLDAEYSAEALASIISGEYSPCGKLSRTVYIDSDRIFKKQATYKQRGMKSGPFIGYKYYDTAEFYPKYVFGHGLSYAKFAYSSVSTNVSPTEMSVTFTIKNCGKIRAAEIAQVYVGMQGSAIIRPKKELCAFAKIELEAGETRTVTIPFSLPEILDMDKGQFAEDMGTNTIYIGSSVRDIRLMCTLYAGDAKIKPDGEKATSYLLSESNIISDNYKLEADCKIMKKSVFNIIAGIAALLLAVLLKVYCLATNTNALFFDIIAIILAAAGWVFFIVEAVARKKDSKADKQTIEAANEEAFEEAEKVEISMAEQLFAQEFDVTYSEAEVSATETYSDGVEAENMMYVDGELDLATASREFSEVAKEKGIDFSESDAGKLFSSMASSRVLLLHGMSTKAFDSFMQVLSDYFETAVYKDNVNGSYKSPENILFASDSAGTYTKTNIMIGMEEAQSAVEKVHFLGFNGVKPQEMADWFAPIAKHAKNPYAHYSFKARNEQNVETVYYFPQNAWFVVNLAESASYAEIPANVAEIATVNTFALQPCEAATVYSSHRSFTYYQIEYLCDKLVSSMNIGENVWRRFDRLEAFVNSHMPFTFGNKLWLCIEKYIAISLSCGKEQEKTIDECLAAKLLPAIIVALNGKIAQGDASLSETLENIFGEENVAACKKVIKASGADIV